MAEKQGEGKDDIEIIDERDYPNCKKIQIRTTVNDEEYVQWFGFSWRQIKDESYKQSIRRHVEKLREAQDFKSPQLKNQRI